jgi:hypothetical protein
MQAESGKIQKNSAQVKPATQNQAKRTPKQIEIGRFSCQGAHNSY